MEMMMLVLLGTLVGVAVHVFDAKYGVAFNRQHYNATHERPLAASAIVKGFVIGRSAKTRATVATVVSFACMGVVMFMGYVHPLYAVLLAVLAIPCIMIGFYAGQRVSGAWGRTDEVFDYMDRVEAGEVNLAEDLRQGATRVGRKIGQSAASLATSAMMGESPAPDGEQHAASAAGAPEIRNETATEAPVQPLPTETKPATDTLRNAEPKKPEEEDPREVLKRFTRGR